MCSAWHRISGLGKYTNVTPTWGEGFTLVVTRDRTRELNKGGQEALESLVKEVNSFLEGRDPKTFIEVLTAARGRSNPLYVAGDTGAWKKWRRDR